MTTLLRRSRQRPPESAQAQEENPRQLSRVKPRAAALDRRHTADELGPTDRRIVAGEIVTTRDEMRLAQRHVRPDNAVSKEPARARENHDIAGRHGVEIDLFN